MAGIVCGESCPDRPSGQTRDIIARYVGLSGRSLDQIEAIPRAAEENPARCGSLKEQMEKGDKNDRLNRLSLEPRHHQEAEAAAGKSTHGPPTATPRQRRDAAEAIRTDRESSATSR